MRRGSREVEKQRNRSRGTRSGSKSPLLNLQSAGVPAQLGVEIKAAAVGADASRGAEAKPEAVEAPKDK